MLTSLLVPLDGSDLAERVIPFAARLASSTKARIILAHARVPRINGDSTEFALRAVAERLRVVGIAVDVCMLDVGPDNVGEAVAAVAREHQANLVVMSAHGHGGIGRRHYGTVAHQLLQAVEAPVLLVPAPCRHPWAHGRPLRVLVRLEGAELAESVLRWAAVLARTLLLVRVIQIHGLEMYTTDYVYPRLDGEADMADASRYRDVVERLRAEGHAVELRVIVATPALDLARFARDEGADFIATAMHGYGILDDLMLGSVSTVTLQRADMPILLVRPARTDDSTEQQLPVEPEADRAAPGLTPVGSTVSARPSSPDPARPDQGSLAYATA